MSRAKIIALLFCLPLLVGALWGAHWLHGNDSNVAAGQAAYRDGDFDSAVHAFRRALKGEGEASALLFNLGTALVQRSLNQEDREKRLRGLDLAIVSLSRAKATRDRELLALVRYNLGNALLLRGRATEAIVAYRSVLIENADHDDARNNLELALLAARSLEAAKDRRSHRLPESDDLKMILAAAMPRQEGAAQSVAIPGKGGEGAKAGAESDQAEGKSAKAEGGAAGAEALGSADSAAGGQAGQGNAEGPPNAAESESQEGESMGSPGRSSSNAGSPLSLQKKLEALERRSAELRRKMLLQKTTERLRVPDKRGSDQ